MTQWNRFQWSAPAEPIRGVRIYRLSGVLTDTRESFEFIDRVREDLRTDPRPALFDLRSVERLTSAGVGMIATAYTSAQHANQRIALHGLNPIVRRILDVVQLTRFIATFDSEDEALSASSGSGWERP